MSIVICKLTKPLMGYSKNAIVITDSECAMIGMIIDKGDEHFGWYVLTTLERNIYTNSYFTDIKETDLTEQTFNIIFRLIQSNNLKITLDYMLKNVLHYELG